MTITCPQCKYQNPDDAEFCENCGAQLPVAVPTGAAPASFSSGPLSAPAAPPPASQLACPNCRAPLAPGDEFCFNCGTDVRNMTRTAAPVGNQPFNPNANSNMVDPNAPTTISPVTPLKDDDINRMLAEIDNPGPAKGPAQGPASGPIPAPAPDPDEANAPTVHAIPSGSLSAANAGPEAQPVAPPSQVVTPPPPAQTSGGSIPVPPGPAGGVAGNAFGAPPAPAPVANPPISTGGSLTLLISGPYGEERVDWKGTEILLGRNDAKTRVFPEVNLDDSAASRRHLSIWLDEIDNRYYAQDLESANGTVLNGRDLKPGEPTSINNGDVLKIGTRYSIKVQIS